MNFDRINRIKAWIESESDPHPVILSFRSGCGLGLVAPFRVVFRGQKFKRSLAYPRIRNSRANEMSVKPVKTEKSVYALFPIGTGYCSIHSDQNRPKRFFEKYSGGVGEGVGKKAEVRIMNYEFNL